MLTVNNNCYGNYPNFSIVQTQGDHRISLCVDRTHGYDVKIFASGSNIEMTITMAELEELFEQYKKALKAAK